MNWWWTDDELMMNWWWTDDELMMNRWWTADEQLINSWSGLVCQRLSQTVTDWLVLLHWTLKAISGGLDTTASGAKNRRNGPWWGPLVRCEIVVTTYYVWYSHWRWRWAEWKEKMLRTCIGAWLERAPNMTWVPLLSEPIKPQLPLCCASREPQLQSRTNLAPGPSWSRI